jgi:hypothetical protein
MLWEQSAKLIATAIAPRIFAMFAISPLSGRQRKGD